MIRIPLFPLQLVLFPSVPLPLHVFEERYRLLVSRCIEERSPFGVVYHQGERMRGVGCSAIIDRVIKHYEDGRMDILTIGSERFAIEAVDDSGLYLEADVRFLDDPPEHDVEGLAARAVDALLKYAFYAEVELDRTSLSALTANQLSYLIAGIDLLGNDSKQELLETDAPELRLERALGELDRVNDRLVAAARLRKLAGEELDIGEMMN